MKPRTRTMHFRQRNTATAIQNQKCAALNKNVHLSSGFVEILDYPFPEYIQLIISSIFDIWDRKQSETLPHTINSHATALRSRDFSFKFSSFPD